MTALTQPRPWTDHRGWLAQLANATDKDTTLYRWVASGRGFVEGAVAFLPALAPSPARNALVGALLANGIAARIGAASSPRPDFGAELRGRLRNQPRRSPGGSLRPGGVGRCGWGTSGR